MAAHLYWRLNVSAINGGANLSVAELGLFVANGASSAATGGTASASTTNGSQTASLAFDGNTSTYWQATTTSGQLQYLFGSAVDITSYQVTARNDSNQPTQAPRTWALEYSDNGSTWTAADSVDKQRNWAQGETRIYTVGLNAGTSVLAKRITPQGPNGVQGTPPAASVVLIGMRSASPAKTVSGTVTVLGVATAGIIVCAYDKISRQLIGRAVTDGSGNYSIPCGNFPNVYVCAFNPTTYQMIGFDEVVPG